MNLERANAKDSKRFTTGSLFTKQSSLADARMSQSAFTDWNIENITGEKVFKAEVRFPPNLKAFLHTLMTTKFPIQLWVVFATHQLVLCFTQLPKTFFIKLRVNYRMVSPAGIDSLPTIRSEGADPMGYKIMSACFELQEFKKLIDAQGEDHPATLTFEKYESDAIQVISSQEVTSAWGKETYKAVVRGFCSINGTLVQGVPLDNFDSVIASAASLNNQLLTIDFQNVGLDLTPRKHKLP